MTDAPANPAPSDRPTEPPATPYLLVIPSAPDAPGTIAWPGPDGAPAWAIPVTVPAGTRGYALFVPLVADGSAAPLVAGGSATLVTDASATLVADASVAPVAVADTPPSVGAEHSAGPATTSAAEPLTAIAPPSADPVPQTIEVASVPGAGWAPAIPAPRGFTGGYTRPVIAPGFLATRWPGPAPARGWAVPAGVLAAALGSAVFLPLGRTGIGWFLAGLMVVIGVIAAVRRQRVKLPRAERWVRLAWAVAALALLSVLAFRNAWWLVTFSVLGALGCATLAIVGGRTVRSILFGLVAAPFAALRGIAWVSRHLPVQDREGAAVGFGRRAFWSIIATVAVLVVFGTLLSSADAVFSNVLSSLVPNIDAGSAFRWVFLLVLGALIAVAAVYTIASPPDLSEMDKQGRRPLGVVEWALPVGALVILFGGFVAVQFTVLFGGQRHVLETDGLNYADYARSGFWQLLAVTVLTLAVLGGVTRWAKRDRPADRALLRVLLGLLCALSIVIVISALYRMYTYQKVYSFTGERIFVMSFELLLGTIFLMIMAAGIRWRGSWIPRLTAALAVVLLLSLAVLNPEAYAARRNIERYQDVGKIDAWYLRALSADATAALTQLPDAVRRCTLSWIAPKLDEPDPWYGWNLGRVQARRALAQLPSGAIGGPSDCRSADQFDFPKTR